MEVVQILHTVYKYHSQQRQRDRYEKKHRPLFEGSDPVLETVPKASMAVNVASGQ